METIGQFRRGRQSIPQARSHAVPFLDGCDGPERDEVPELDELSADCVGALP